MSQEHGRNDETWDADASIVSATIGAFRHRFVKITGAHTVGLCGAGQRAIGVLKNDPERVGGVAAVRKPTNQVSTKVVAGAAFAAGAELMSDATGRAITATAGNVVNGIATEAALAAGDVVEITGVIGRVAA